MFSPVSNSSTTFQYQTQATSSKQANLNPKTPLIISLPQSSKSCKDYKWKIICISTITITTITLASLIGGMAYLATHPYPYNNTIPHIPLPWP